MLCNGTRCLLLHWILEVHSLKHSFMTTTWEISQDHSDNKLRRPKRAVIPMILKLVVKFCIERKA